MQTMKGTVPLTATTSPSGAWLSGWGPAGSAATASLPSPPVSSAAVEATPAAAAASERTSCCLSAAAAIAPSSACRLACLACLQQQRMSHRPDNGEHTCLPSWLCVSQHCNYILPKLPTDKNHTQPAYLVDEAGANVHCLYGTTGQYRTC